jgi:hypothetical protein
MACWNLKCYLFGELMILSVVRIWIDGLMRSLYSIPICQRKATILLRTVYGLRFSVAFKPISHFDFEIHNQESQSAWDAVLFPYSMLRLNMLLKDDSIERIPVGHPDWAVLRGVTRRGLEAGLFALH